MEGERLALEIESGRLPGVSPLRDGGPHALAVAHLFDQIVGDAYHASLGRLRCYGPDVMERELGLRAAVTPAGNLKRSGLVVLDRLPDDLADADRVYWIVRRGVRRGHLGPEWICLNRLEVLTNRVLLWGILIRLSGIIGRLDWFDRAMAQMRRQFSFDGRGRGYYQLSIWTRRASYHG